MIDFAMLGFRIQASSNPVDLEVTRGFSLQMTVDLRWRLDAILTLGNPVSSLHKPVAHEAAATSTRRLDWQGKNSKMREVFNTIRGNAVCFPDYLAIVLPNEKITYGELWRKVSIAWTKIEGLGLDRERPVVLLIDNPVRHTIIRFALMCAGYCVAPIRMEQIPLIDRINPEVVFTDIYGIFTDKIRLIQIENSFLDGDFQTVQYHKNLRPSRIGTISFTSGSTGLPKPIAKTFGGLEDGVRIISNYRKPSQRVYMNYGLTTHGSGWLPRLLSEVSTIFFSGSEERYRFLTEMKVDEILCSPSQIEALIDSKPKNAKNVRIEQVTLASAPLSHHLWEKIVKNFGCKICRIYNSSESIAIAISIGKSSDIYKNNRFVPISYIEIVDHSGSPLPYGSMGRIKIYSQRVSFQYKGSLCIDQSTILPEFYLSNDLGILTQDGFLELCGRADETINFGGAKFAPEIPEEIFRRHPLISDAGVVAIRSENAEQEVWLALVAPNGIDPNLLNLWYAQNTSGETRSMRFDQCFLVDQIPRGFNGKVLRQQLREKLIAMRDRLKKD